MQGGNFYFNMNSEQKKIITKTITLFKKYGVKSVSMDDIANEFAMSKKTLYTLFDSKDNLIEKTICYPTPPEIVSSRTDPINCIRHNIFTSCVHYYYY